MIELYPLEVRTANPPVFTIRLLIGVIYSLILMPLFYYSLLLIGNIGES